MERAKKPTDPTPRARHPYTARRPGSGYLPRPPFHQRKSQSVNIKPSTNVFISYIPPEFTEQDLRNLCAPYGEITCSKIMINLVTGQSRCFGFVRFKELSQSAAAIKGIDGMQIGNKILLAKYAESKEKQENVTNVLFVKKIPLTVDLRDVYQLFVPFGEISSVTPQSGDVVEAKYWRCFVQYTTKQSATAALDVMNNKIIIPGTMPIHVTYAYETRNSVGYVMSPFQSTTDISAEEQRKLLPGFFFD